MMSIKHNRPAVKLGKWNELKAWYDSWLVPFGMTESYGLAKHALKYGLKPIVIKESQNFHMFLPKNWKLAPILKLMLHYMGYTYKRIRGQALERGVEEKNIKINPSLIKRLLDSKIHPILMVDQSKYAWDENFANGVLHWVVVTNYDQRCFTIQDPDIKPNIKLTNEEFEKAIDLSNFGTDRRLVILRD